VDAKASYPPPVSFEDIIRRNRRALGQPEIQTFVPATTTELEATRYCPKCGGCV
jgi:hypothetical protein